MASVVVAFSAVAQPTFDGGFRLALPEHRGQLSWSADGFKVVQSSAKPGGREIGIRGKDRSGRLAFLGFFSLFPDQAPLTSAKCRDGVLDPEKKSNKTLKVLTVSDVAQANSMPVSLVSYTSEGRNGKTAYMGPKTILPSSTMYFFTHRSYTAPACTKLRDQALRSHYRRSKRTQNQSRKHSEIQDREARRHRPGGDGIRNVGRHSEGPHSV